MFKLFVVTTIENALKSDIIDFDYVTDANKAADCIEDRNGKNGIHYTVIKLWKPN